MSTKRLHRPGTLPGIAAGIAVLAGACAGTAPEPAAPPPPTATRVPAATGDLTFFVTPAGESGWTVDLDRDASVALFEVIPHVGAGMLFPGDLEDGGRLSPGRTDVRADLRIFRRHERYYQPLSAGPLNRAPLEAVREASPRNVLAVASECPLRLSDISEPRGPRDLAGPFASLTLQDAHERILRAILPTDGRCAWAAMWVEGAGGP